MLTEVTIFTNQLNDSVIAGPHVKVCSQLKNDKKVITDDFLKMFAEVVKPHWNLLAPYIISYTDLTKENNLYQLQAWKEKIHPTYEFLYECLNQLIINPVNTQEDGRQKGILICNYHW